MLPHRISIITTIVVATLTTFSIGADSSQPDDTRQLTGISLTGDKEAPKSLYIVPWKNTEHEQNTSLSSNFTDSSMQAVDRESFLRQLQLYEHSKKGWHKTTAESP